MAQKKYDGIIEGARYTPEGKLAEVRYYERRGPTFSDRSLMTRADLLQRLRARKKFAVGTRKTFMASTFDIIADVRLAGSRGQEAIVAGSSTAADRDDLQGAPLF
jgi:hypothetical protein